MLLVGPNIGEKALYSELKVQTNIRKPQSSVEVFTQVTNSIAGLLRGTENKIKDQQMLGSELESLVS